MMSIEDVHIHMLKRPMRGDPGWGGGFGSGIGDYDGKGEGFGVRNNGNQSGFSKSLDGTSVEVDGCYEIDLFFEHNHDTPFDIVESANYFSFDNEDGTGSSPEVKN